MGGDNKVRHGRLRVGRWLLDSVMRLRHFRGHGVHSPYIYNIVRRVFMHKGLIGSDGLDLYEQLANCIDIKTATELQNIATVCGYTKYQVDPTAIDNESDFIIWTKQHPINLIRESLEYGATIAVLFDGIDSDFKKLESEIWASHKSTIIKRRRYLLIFNNHLPKQRFAL